VAAAAVGKLAMERNCLRAWAQWASEASGAELAEVWAVSPEVEDAIRVALADPPTRGPDVRFWTLRYLLQVHDRSVRPQDLLNGVLAGMVSGILFFDPSGEMAADIEKLLLEPPLAHERTRELLEERTGCSPE